MPDMSPSTPATESWGLAHRIAFRFTCSYILLFYFPSPVDLLPGTTWFTEAYEQLWHHMVPWVGRAVLHLETEITVFPNGSGDTTYNYVQLLCYAVLSAVATLVWSWLDRRRTEYRKAHAWLRIYSRYVLAVFMLTYGLDKVFLSQFPSPSPERLLQPYGESSPMGLLWTFMGAAPAYQFFGGLAEVTGGLLLFFRRTTTLGALVVAGVMSNVVMLNFTYDVPVKILSSHLLLLAVFLMLPDLRRLANLLVLNRPTEPVVLRTPLPKPWMERGRLVAKVLFIGAAVVTPSVSLWESHQEDSLVASTFPLYGLYDVEEFTRGGEVLPALPDHATRWQRVTVNDYGYLVLKLMNQSRQVFKVEDDLQKTLTLSSRDDKTQKAVLTYSRPDPDHLLVEGTLKDEALKVRLKKIDTSNTVLMNRGFHWINERPFSK